MAPSDSLTGNETPELLLPGEIFGSFVRHALAYDDRVADEFVRDACEKGGKFGLPPDFMNVVKEETAQAVELEKRVRQIQERITKGAGNETDSLLSELEDTKTEACRARAAALGVLRQKFPQFDQFLYTAIASSIFFTSNASEAELRVQEAGCP